MAVRRYYPTAADGEWIQPIPTGFRVACCDCGLVHVLDWRLVDGTRRVQFRVRRDRRATAEHRRQQAGLRAAALRRLIARWKRQAANLQQNQPPDGGLRRFGEERLRCAQTLARWVTRHQKETDA